MSENVNNNISIVAKRMTLTFSLDEIKFIAPLATFIALDENERISRHENFGADQIDFTYSG